MDKKRPSAQRDARRMYVAGSKLPHTKARSDLHWRAESKRSFDGGRWLSGGAAGACAPFRRPIFVVLALGVLLVALIALGFAATGGLLTIRPVTFAGGSNQARVSDANQNGASALVEVALDELDSVSRAGEASAWRDAYTRFTGQPSTEPWSTAFVVYCGDLCGFVESTLMPRASSADEFRQYYESDPDKGLVRVNDGEYEPQPGDIVVLDEVDQDRLAVVTSYDESSATLMAVEGDVGGSIAETSYALDSSVHSFITPAYPEVAPAPLDDGEVIAIPAGLGNVDAFEGWSLITDPTSTEYQLRVAAGEQYDMEGFGIVNGRYVVAVRPLYGSVGDYLTFTFEDGSTLDCIIGDVKGEDGAGVNEWGFLGGENILEFVVHTDNWYAGHENPGTPSCHPEWGQYLVSCVNTGNYWGM